MAIPVGDFFINVVLRCVEVFTRLSEVRFYINIKTVLLFVVCFGLCGIRFRVRIIFILLFCYFAVWFLITFGQAKMERESFMDFVVLD